MFDSPDLMTNGDLARAFPDVDVPPVDPAAVKALATDEEVEWLAAATLFDVPRRPRPPDDPRRDALPGRHGVEGPR